IETKMETPTRLDYARIHNRMLPILKLPFELAYMIFKLAYDTSSGGHSIGIEVVVSHVCRSWRSISIACPELWSTFNHPSCAVHRQESIHRLVTYLERSCNKPLNLSFHVSSEDRSAGRPAIANVLEKIILHVSRWRQLSISISNAWPANYLFKQLESLSAPNLELLEIYTSEFDLDRIQRVTKRVCFLGGTPKLRSLRMDSGCFISCKLPTTVNIRLITLQLERLSSHRVIHPWKDFLALLSSPDLVNLSLAGNFFAKPNRSPGIQPTKVTATHLTNFRCSDKNVAQHMWNSIRAPRLQLLVLKGAHFDLSTFPYSIISVNNPPLFPSLETLALINCESVPRAITVERLTEVTKNITRLVVSQNPLGKNNVVDYMIKLIAPPRILWPHLKDLTFINFSEYYFDGLDASTALALVKHHLETSKTHCTVRILDRHDDWWRQADPESWIHLRQGGFLQRIVAPEDGVDHVPWPPRNGTNFKPSSESPFVTYAY
ncbi:hypothetical protein BDZ97DRAFT_1836532, partial [Flammula alnicola]